MVAIEYRKGLHLPAAGLWLDPWTPRDRAFVSHAHSDHTGRHRHLICTAPTARLMQARMGGDIGQMDILPFTERRVFGPWAATLFPAGHVLGSAQFFTRTTRGRCSTRGISSSARACRRRSSRLRRPIPS